MKDEINQITPSPSSPPVKGGDKFEHKVKFILPNWESCVIIPSPLRERVRVRGNK